MEERVWHVYEEKDRKDGADSSNSMEISFFLDWMKRCMKRQMHRMIWLYIALVVIDGDSRTFVVAESIVSSERLKAYNFSWRHNGCPSMGVVSICSKPSFTPTTNGSVTTSKSSLMCLSIL
jgi:hypothetical protein